MHLSGANYARLGVANEPPVELKHGALFAWGLKIGKHWEVRNESTQ